MGFNFNPSKGPIQVTYFKGGRTNVCYNALDRHVKAGCGSRPAILWEGNDIGDERRVSYQEALNIVSQLVSCFVTVIQLGMCNLEENQVILEG